MVVKCYRALQLALQRFGPFMVVEREGVNTFEFDLGAACSTNTIPVFHVKYLSAAPAGPYVSGSEALLNNFNNKARLWIAAL